MRLCPGIYSVRTERWRASVCVRKREEGRSSVTQRLMTALSSFILIAAVDDLSVTLATVAAGQREVPYCSSTQA